MTALITRAIRRPMDENTHRRLSNNANTDGRSTDDEQRQYQFGGDLVITSSASAGAWMSATYPVDLTEAQ